MRLFPNESKGKAFLMEIKLSVTYMHENESFNEIEPVSRIHSHMNGWTQRLILRTFAGIVSAYPYCARLHAQIHMPRHASSMRTKC